MPLRVFLLLTGLTVLLYMNTLRNPFIWDDLLFIAGNTHVQNVEYIDNLFTESFCAGSKRDCWFYRPIVGLSYLLDYTLWGEDPWGYHLTNLLIHLSVVIGFYWVIHKVFQNVRVSIIASLIFTVHPIHSESVAFVAARTDPPAALFLLISFYLFTKGIRAPKPLTSFTMVFSVLSFGVALLTKEIAIMLPFLLLIYDLVFVRPWSGLKELASRWKLYLSYGGMIVLYFLARTSALGHSFREDLQLRHIWFRILEAPALVWDYFRLQVIPYPLMMIHGKPSVFGSELMGILWGNLFLGLFLIMLFWLGKRSKGILFGGLWFFIFLFPVLNVIPIWDSVMERFSYIPSLGFALGVGFMGDLLMGLAARRSTVHLRKGLVAGFALLLIIFSLMTILRNRVWSDQVLFWEDTVSKAPYFAMGHMNLGIAYKERGQLEKAVEAFQISFQLNPEDPNLYHNLGMLYQEMDEYGKALQIYQSLVAQDLGSWGTYHNMGMIYEKQGRLEDAVTSYKQALKLNPDLYNSHIRLARVWMRLGELDHALGAFQEAVRINPERRTPYLEMGELYLLKGQLGKAEEAFRLFIEYSSRGKHPSDEILFAERRLDELRRQKNNMGQ